jgi:hypothetical protein
MADQIQRGSEVVSKYLLNPSSFQIPVTDPSEFGGKWMARCAIINQENRNGQMLEWQHFTDTEQQANDYALKIAIEVVEGRLQGLQI